MQAIKKDVQTTTNNNPKVQSNALPTSGLKLLTTDSYCERAKFLQSQREKAVILEFPDPLSLPLKYWSPPLKTLLLTEESSSSSLISAMLEDSELLENRPQLKGASTRTKNKFTVKMECEKGRGVRVISATYSGCSKDEKTCTEQMDKVMIIITV